MGAQPSSNGAAAVATRGDASDAADRAAAPRPAVGDGADIRDDYERVGVSPPSPSQTPVVATSLTASGFLEILPPPEAVRSETAIDTPPSSPSAPSPPGTSTPPNANRSVVCVSSTAGDSKAPAPIPASSESSEIKRSSSTAATTTTTTTTTTAPLDREASSAAVATSIVASPPARSPPPPRLIRALYGTPTSTIDATQKLTRLLPWPIVLDRSVDPNAYFGADPQRGAPKSLWLILSEDVRGVATRRVAMVLRERECRWDPNAVAEPELVQISA